MVYRILVSSYTSNITTLSFNPLNASLKVVSSINAGYHPSWITPYPDDLSFIFTGLEQSDGKVVVLKYDDAGHGKIVATAPSGGEDPCSLLATKEELLITNYSSGSIASLPLTTKSPHLVLPSSPNVIQLNGSGPNKDRQGGSHPHQIVLHEAYGELLVPDLGADRVCRFQKVKGGTWELRGHVQFESGGGPRHIAFHDGDLFTLLELSNKLVRHRFPPLPELSTFVTSVPTMSKPLPLPNNMLAAEILIPPTNSSFSTPYLYLSNRNDPSSDGDIIAIFSLEKRDALELVSEFRTGLKHVRGMMFGGPHDRYLIAGGVNGGGVRLFERVEGGKNLKLVAAEETIEAPTGFIWI